MDERDKGDKTNTLLKCKDGTSDSVCVQKTKQNKYTNSDDLKKSLKPCSLLVTQCDGNELNNNVQGTSLDPRCYKTSNEGSSYETTMKKSLNVSKSSKTAVKNNSLKNTKNENYGNCFEKSNRVLFKRHANKPFHCFSGSPSIINPSELLANCKRVKASCGIHSTSYNTTRFCQEKDDSVDDGINIIIENISWSTSVFGAECILYCKTVFHQVNEEFETYSLDPELDYTTENVGWYKNVNGTEYIFYDKTSNLSEEEDENIGFSDANTERNCFYESTSRSYDYSTESDSSEDEVARNHFNQSFKGKKQHVDDFRSYGSKRNLSSLNKKKIDSRREGKNNKINKWKNLECTIYNLKPCSVSLTKERNIDSMGEKLRNMSKKSYSLLNYATVTHDEHMKHRSRSVTEKKHENSKVKRSDVSKGETSLLSLNHNRCTKLSKSYISAIKSKSVKIHHGSHTNRNYQNNLHNYDELAPSTSTSNMLQGSQKTYKRAFENETTDKRGMKKIKMPFSNSKDTDADKTNSEGGNEKYIFRNRMGRKYAVDLFAFDNKIKLYVTVHFT